MNAFKNAVSLWQGQKDLSRLLARSVLLHFVQRSPPETRTPRHAPRASESNRFTQCQNKNGHLSVTVSVLAGAEGFVSPVGSVGASALRAEVSAGDPHPSTRSACRAFEFSDKTKKRHREDVSFCLAGAEGFEPSARGFGDRCSTN